MACADGVDDFMRWFFMRTLDGSDFYRLGWRVDEFGMVKIGVVVCGG